MIKIPTLYKREINDFEVTLTDELREGFEWVEDGLGKAYVKHDGTACLIHNGKFYCRYDTWLGNKGKKGIKSKKRANPVPEGSILCNEAPDSESGSFPVFAPIEVLDTKTTFKVNLEVWKKLIETNSIPEDGTYELCGPQFCGNPENLEENILIKHTRDEIVDCPRDFDGIMNFLEENYIEGIVFHLTKDDGTTSMVKIRREDFGFHWKVSGRTEKKHTIKRVRLSFK